ncbi:MAG TPA: CotY/CotZ family spore coat protein [Pseudoneobacillus sp.]|nr:CotY/CotZ family spore coat protein [Pseudoneobacillus sp.]
MSCRGHNGFDSDNCVCAVLRRIADVQDALEPDTTGPCTTSCERSIAQLEGLVSPVTNGPDTIPVILYCDCEPFLGTGVRLNTPGASSNVRFECIQSFLFRVNSVDEDCCATLELLTAGGGPNPQDPCSQFPGGSVGLNDIDATGICITVDLNCFCGVTCLDPVRVNRD